MADFRYPLAAVEVPPTLPAEPAPSLYGDYKQMLEAGLSQRGPLQGSRVWRAGLLGDLNIFRGQPLPSSLARASACLLWDWSVSQSPFYATLIAGLTSITDALSRLHFEIWAGAYTASREVAHESNGFVSIGCVIGIVKGFADPFDARRIATLRHMASGGTPTGAALQYVRSRVLPTAGPGRKRLVIVATDGEADNEPYQQAEVRRISALRDTTLVALYCGNEAQVFHSLQRIYPACFWASSRAALPAAFAHTLRALRGGL